MYTHPGGAARGPLNSIAMNHSFPSIAGWASRELDASAVIWEFLDSRDSGD